MGNRRRETPGLMDGLLSGNTDSTPPERSTAAPPPRRQPASRAQQPVRRQPEPPPEPEPPKAKATFYITEDVQLDLDLFQARLRRIAPADMKKQQISKSAIVETAIRIAIAEFEQKGDRSLLTRELFGTRTF